MNRQTEDRVILAVSASETDVKSLEGILSGSDWRIWTAFGKSDALAALGENGRAIGVVVCASNLADGDWRDLLNEIVKSPARPSLIVMSRWADEHLWAEVLNRGGYDVLATPFVPEEVLRVASAAWRARGSARNHPVPQ